MFLKNIIIQKESDFSIRQWQLDQKKIFIIAFSVIVTFSILIFFISNLIGSFIYENKINEYKSNYDYVSKKPKIFIKKNDNS